MPLTCPQCETIFRVDRLRLHPAGQPVHCMICDHIWTARLVTRGDRQDMPSFASYLHKFRLPVIAVLICAGLMTSLIKGRGILTAYFPGLIARAFTGLVFPYCRRLTRFLWLILTGLTLVRCCVFVARFAMLDHGLGMLRHCGFGSRVQMG